jgi:hypothetical protein
MTTKNQYFRGRGDAKLARLDADGKPLGFRIVGDCSELKLEATVETAEHVESQSGYDMTDLKFITSKKLKVTLTLDSFDDENLALAMYGNITEDTGTGTFTQVLNGPFEKGLSYKFGNTGYTITSVTDADDEVIPASGYKVYADGTVSFLDAAAITGPVTIAGNKAASTSVSLMGAGMQNLALLVNGLNTVNGNSPVIVMINRLSFDPASGGIDVFGKDLGKLTITGEALYDPNDAAGSAIMAGFGSITRPKA